LQRNSVHGHYLGAKTNNMLNGIDPIFLFNFSKNVTLPSATTTKIPLVAEQGTSIPLPPIPLYLSERLTGIYVVSESKSISIQTDLDAPKDGTDPIDIQRPLDSSVSIEMKANKNSLGLTILSAMADVILSKLSSKEYSISYLHQNITVFYGKIQAFNISQSADTDLFLINMTLSNFSKKTILPTSVPVVGKSTGAIPAL
jgi:hypothetical protein